MSADVYHSGGDKLMKHFLRTLSGIFLLVALLSCATSPTGRKQLILLPDDQMDQMGVASYAEMKKKQPIERSTRYNAYVSCVARAITNELTGKWGRQQWEVTVFKDDSANAFALPGGKIGVHTGLFKAAKNQDQLAAVLGHEVGHVLARHSNERVSTGIAAETGLQITSAMLKGSTAKRQAIMAALGVGAQYGVILPFSRTHESEADLIGLKLMAKAGFDPRQAVKLWENMSKLGGGKPPEFLSTHPSGKTRIHDLNRAMPEAMALYQEALRKGKRPDCDRYL
jgi:predicted Zn-dependent protease